MCWCAYAHILYSLKKKKSKTFQWWLAGAATLQHYLDVCLQPGTAISPEPSF